MVNVQHKHDVPNECKILIVHFINQKYSNCMSKQLRSPHAFNPLSNYEKKKQNLKVVGAFEPSQM